MPTANVVKRKGIVTRLTEHKDADLIVTALDQDGAFSFYAKGARKVTSKNAAALQVLVESEFVLSLPSSGGIPILKESAAKHSFAPQGDLDACIIANMLLEAFAKFFGEEDGPLLYPWLRAALEAIEAKSDPLTVGLIYFAHCLIFAGIGLEVDECVLCGSKSKIACMSFREGGFVCEEDFDPLSMERSPTMTLKIMRYIFKAPKEDFGRVSLERGDALRALKSLLDYAYEMSGVRITSCQFLFES